RWDERPNRSRSRPASHTSGGCMPEGAFFSAFVTAVNLCKLFGQDTGPLQAPGCTAMQQGGQIRLFVSMGWGGNWEATQALAASVGTEAFPLPSSFPHTFPQPGSP